MSFCPWVLVNAVIGNVGTETPTVLTLTVYIRILTDMKNRPKRRLEFWIAQDQYESLLARYERLGVPIAEQIRRAIDESLEKQGKLSSVKGRKDDGAEN